MSYRKSLCLSFVLASLIAPQAAFSQHGASAARIKAGKETFDAVGCSSCHGFAGQGGIGPMSGPRIADLPAEAIIAIIRQPPEPMPVFSEKVLPDEKVSEIADYLHSMPPAKKLSAVPALSEIKGKNGK
jgi:mono/diheme cytochrome c family protein